MKRILLICTLFASINTFAQKQLQNESSGMLSFASGKIMQLAEAMPADKYAWSPEDGVRSFAGILHHVISANYFFATKMGASMPEGVNLETLEQDLKTKEDIMPALKKSSDFIAEAIKNVEDQDLANKIEFPAPGEYTVTSAILIGFSHCNEHLGQLIAYSRMNGVAPPWSEN
jgi:uncharacterized damage-inducible protein DinB